MSSGGGEDVHQGFQNLLSEVNRPGTQCLLRTANRLFGEKTYDFLSVSHTRVFPKQIETEVGWRRELGLAVQLRPYGLRPTRWAGCATQATTSHFLEPIGHCL